MHVCRLNMSCIICQYCQSFRISDIGDESVVTLGKKGIASLLAASKVRERHLLHDAVLNHQACSETIKAHLVCRRDFVDLRKFISEEKPPPAKRTRSLLEPFDWKKCCLFCENLCDWRHNNRKRVCMVETINLRNNILQVCIENPEDPSFLSIEHRVRNCIDLVSVKARYHKTCLDSFFHQKYNNNATADDEKKAVDQDQKPADDECQNTKRKPGKPKDPIMEVAYRNTCEWLEGTTEPKSLQEVEAHMAVITGKENMWSRRYLQSKLVQTYGDRICTTEGYRNMIHLKEMAEKITNERESEAVCNDKKITETIEEVKEGITKSLVLSQSWIESVRNIIQPIREDIFKRKNAYSGSLKDKHQDEYMSPFLLELISMLIDGEEKPKNQNCSQAALTVAGLITFNIRKIQKSQSLSVNHRHHNRERETPVSIYVGLKIYSTVRSRNLIQRLFELGICISYDRILSITKSVYESLQKNFARYGIFLPSNVKKGCFVVLVKDNIDKNATANLVQSHYHGTSISLLQFPTHENQGEKLNDTDFVDTAYNLKKLAPLPAEYTVPKKMYRLSDDFFAPVCTHMFSDLDEFPDLDLAKNDEYQWLHQFATSGDQAKSWAQFHIDRAKSCTENQVDGNESKCFKGTNALLPLLRDKVNTLDMQCHTMRLNIKSVEAVNPGQTPVDVSDCPIFALTKEAQYRFAEEFSNYFPMFGGLHIEQCLLVVHGQFIEGSGLKEILESCSLATIGVGAVVDVNQIKRARYGLQVSCCALYRKLVDAVKKDNSNLLPFEWLKEKSASSGMCHYWSMVLDLQLDILLFVRSIREGNFSLYVQSLRKLLKWLFALDHYNYARWLTIFVFDLLSLHITHPDIYQQMVKGCFSFAKTERPFSRMALDQVHEQNNKVIKGQGGATNFLNCENESALIRWETCGPEVSRIVSEFEELLNEASQTHCSGSLKHHEDNECFRENFAKDVSTVYNAIPCNLFEMTSLSTLNNSEPFPLSTIDDIKQVLPTGEEQVKAFIKDRLLMQKLPITAKISKNKFPLLKSGPSKIHSVTSVNLGTPFMNKLRSAVEHRPSLAHQLFEEELYGVPHCFSVDGTDEMYHGTKSSIKDRFPSSQPPVPVAESRRAIVIEASPLIHKLSNVEINNFHEFAVVFYNHVARLAAGFDRLDVVFDRYFRDSLKAQTRKGRGSGGTRMLEISDDVLFPHNFHNSFLNNSENKNDLGLYLAQKLISLHHDADMFQLQLCVTYNEKVISQPPLNQSLFQIESTAEEADQKLVRHTLHCIKDGYNDIEIQSIDYDVLILLLAYVAMMMESSNSNNHLNIFFKLVTANPTWFNIKFLINELGTDICKALPFLYAFTGCDTVPSFNGKGKCTFWDHWMKSGMKDDITRTFIKLGNMPASVNSDDTSVVEMLVKSVYYGGIKNFSDTHLNVLRERQFRQSSSNDIRKIAPSSDALHMQILRAIHTAGFEWVECTRNVVLPDPSVRGYLKKDSVYVPKWLPNPPEFNLQVFLQTCKCKTAICKSCKCAQLGIPCLPLCHCNKTCKRV